VEKVRAFIRPLLRPQDSLIEAPENRGIYHSIVGGVTRICENFGRVIVIEDDIVVSPAALTWFNAALNKFQHDEAVWQIAGHQYYVPEFKNYPNGVFLPLTTSWGWATWKRVWDRFDPAVDDWLLARNDAELITRFNVNSAYPYSEIMDAQISSSSERWDWDIRFWWNVFRAGGVGLFPPRSLVENIGFDSSATHHKFGWLRKHFRPRNPLSMDSSSPQLPEFAGVNRTDIEAVARALSRSRTVVQKRPWLRALLRNVNLYPTAML
jgi:hypothetical protein